MAAKRSDKQYAVADDGTLRSRARPDDGEPGDAFEPCTKAEVTAFTKKNPELKDIIKS